MLYHQIKLGNGLCIKIPSSLPSHLQKYIDTNHLINKDKLQSFKQKIDQLILNKNDK